MTPRLTWANWCCDDSPNKHATKHFHRTHHPIIRSFEPEEDWGWCYVDEVGFEPAPSPGGVNDREGRG